MKHNFIYSHISIISLYQFIFCEFKILNLFLQIYSVLLIEGARKANEVSGDQAYKSKRLNAQVEAHVQQESKDAEETKDLKTWKTEGIVNIN